MSRRPEAGKMAPVTTIETISISRPLKVIAFLCGLFASILLLMGLASSEWLISGYGYQQGLFAYCVVAENITVPRLPFIPEYDPEASSVGCHRLDLAEQAYTLVCGAFCVAALLITIFATLLTVLGLRCRDPNRKYKYYRMATGVMTVALVMALVALIVYPIKFSEAISTERLFVVGTWEFGWAYGVGWGASIFLFGGILLLLCDKESEEIYYKERTIVQYADTEDKS